MTMIMWKQPALTNVVVMDGQPKAIVPQHKAVTTPAPEPTPPPEPVT